MTTKEIKNPLINILLHLGDNALILGHRNSEWCGHGPVLEQDIALTNIALDQIGQARNFYQYAAKLISETSVEKITKAVSCTCTFVATEPNKSPVVPPMVKRNINARA